MKLLSNPTRAVPLTFENGYVKSTHTLLVSMYCPCFASEFLSILAGGDPQTPSAFYVLTSGDAIVKRTIWYENIQYIWCKYTTTNNEDHLLIDMSWLQLIVLYIWCIPVFLNMAICRYFASLFLLSNHVSNGKLGRVYVVLNHLTCYYCFQNRLSCLFKKNKFQLKMTIRSNSIKYTS